MMQKTQAADKKIYRWIFCNYRSALWSTGILSALGILLSGSFIVVAWLSKEILDRASGSREGDLLPVCIVLGAVVAGQAALNLLQSVLKTWAQTRMENQIRLKSLQELMKTDYQTFRRWHTGEYMTRLTSDTEIVAGGVVGFLPQVISILTKLILGTAALLVLSWKAALLILAAGVVLAVLAKAIGGKFRSLHSAVQKSRSDVRITMQEHLENIVVVKSFGAERKVEQKMNACQKGYMGARRRQNLAGSAAGTGAYVLMAAGYYMILVWGAVQIAGGQMTFGTLAALLQIAEQVRAPFRSLSGMGARYEGIMASAERILELEELEKEEPVKVPAGEKVREKQQDDGSWDRLVLEHVCFAYDQKVILQDMSTEIQRGQMTVLTGRSGIGKTTLFGLLLSLLHAQEGRIFFTREKEIESEESEEITFTGTATRPMFAYVPQGNLLFHGSVRENLLFGRQQKTASEGGVSVINETKETEITEREIWEALRSVCMEETIRALPDGLDTILMESGGGISEGQRQRIAIARALLSGAEILLLDEATSALDEETERQVWKNLKACKGKTILCISHRPEAIRICEREISIE